MDPKIFRTSTLIIFSIGLVVWLTAMHSGNPVGYVVLLPLSLVGAITLILWLKSPPATSDTRHTTASLIVLALIAFAVGWLLFYRLGMTITFHF